jgi:hypothetical protein
MNDLDWTYAGEVPSTARVVFLSEAEDAVAEALGRGVEQHSHHSDQTTFTWIVALGYPGKEISLYGPFDECGDADRFAKWITDGSGVPATVLVATSVTTGAVMLAKFHARKGDSDD